MAVRRASNKHASGITNGGQILVVIVVCPPAASPAAVVGGCTIGLDLSVRNHYVCVLAAVGQMIQEGPLLNNRMALAFLLTKYPAATEALAPEA